MFLFAGTICRIQGVASELGALPERKTSATKEERRDRDPAQIVLKDAFEKVCRVLPMRSMTQAHVFFCEPKCCTHAEASSHTCIRSAITKCRDCILPFSVIPLPWTRMPVCKSVCLMHIAHELGTTCM